MIYLFHSLTGIYSPRQMIQIQICLDLKRKHNKITWKFLFASYEQILAMDRYS